MHFSLPSDTLKAALATAKLAMSPSTLPILATVHCAVLEDRRTLVLTSTDLDVAIVQTFTMTADGGPGEWCLDFKALAALRPDKGTPVRIDVDPQAAEVIYVSSGHVAKALIPWWGSQEKDNAFPLPLPPSAEAVSCKLSRRTLDAIATALPFASEDATRYVLNGVLLSPGDGGCAVATDGRRLIQLRVPAPPLPCILPTKLCQILGKLKATAATAAIGIHPEWMAGKAMTVTAGNVTVHSKLIEGNFPNYKQVIPRDSTSAITFSEPLAIAAWLRTLPEPKGMNSVKLTPLPPHQVELSHASGQITVTAYLQDNPPATAYYPRFLAAGLAAVGGTLYLTDGEWAGVLRCPGSLAVLMPMRLAKETAPPAVPSIT